VQHDAFNIVVMPAPSGNLKINKHCELVTGRPTSAELPSGGEESPPGGLVRHWAARQEQQRHPRQRPLLARQILRRKAAMVDDHLPP